MNNIIHDLTIKSREAKYGTKKFITRKNKTLEVTIPSGVKNGTLVKLSGALRITDGYYGDLYIQIHIDNKFRNIFIASSVAGLFIIVILVATLKNPLTTPPENGATKSTLSGSDKPTISSLTQVDTSPVYSVLPGENPAFFIPDSVNSTIYNGYLTVLFGKRPNDAFSNKGKPVQISDNLSAVDPTWKELKAFLVLDTTNRIYYIPEFFECASFAEQVHNNAEARGIRAAYVALIYSDEFIGHALNAFHTRAKGLVYVDCSVGADTVAYIKEDKEYGIVPIQVASSFDYYFYIKYHNENRKIYNDLFENPGIVDLVYIYW